MKKLLNFCLVFALMVICTRAFAEVGCKVNGSHANCKSDVITDLDFKAPAGSDVLTQSGLSMAVPVLGSTMFATGVANGGATSIASTTDAIPVGYGFVRMAIPSNGDAAYTAKTLANGYPGEVLTVYVAGLSPSGATTGGNATITPATSTGFSAIKLTAVNDMARFLYMDSTTGWVLIGWNAGASNSVTITLKN